MSDADEREWPLRPASLEGGRGTYRLTARLGARGAAEVYAGRVVRAAAAPAGTPCLIEIRRRGALPDPQADAAAAAAFAGQAALLDALPPDVVVPALDAFAWEGEAVAVFPAAVLDAPDAGRAPRPFPLWRRLRAGTDAVSALAAVHHAGILHRNLNPGAVVLGADGAWRLTGFELAGRIAPDGAGAPPPAAPPAPAYAAPEYFLGARSDVRSDVYSAGATLYYLCTGRPPAPATTAAGIARWHARGTPAVPPPALAPDLPAGIGEVLLRCLDPDPAARFQTAARLRAALLAATAEVEPDGPEPDGQQGAGADAPRERQEATRRPAAALPLTLAAAMAPAPAPAPAPATPGPAGRETAADTPSGGRPPTPGRPWWRPRRGMAAGAAAGAVLLVLWAGRGCSGGGQATVPPSTPAAAAGATARAAASAAGTATAVAESTVVARTRAEAALAAAGDALVACSAVIAPVLQRPPAPAPAAPQPAGPPFSPQTAPRIAAYRTLGSHRAVVLGLAFSPAGDLLASSSGDQTIKLWPVFERPEILSPPGQPGSVESVAYAPNGAVLAAAGDDGAARLWRAGEADAACVLPHGTPVRAVAFSPDGALLATSGDDGAVRLWGVGGGSGLRVLESGVTRGERAASGLAFSPDGRLLASAGADGAVRLWDAASGAPSRMLSGHTDRVQAVAFSPDGRLLASAGADGAARLWDVGAGQQVAAFAHSGPVWAVAFSPDGRLLASGGGDNAVRLWRTEGCPGGGGNATCAAGEAGGLPGAVRALAFSPDGRLLASAGADGAVRLWRTAPG